MNNRIITNMGAVLRMKRRVFLCMLFAALFAVPHTLFAAFAVTLSPAVIDGEVKAREILRYKVTVTNDTKQMVTLYPWARDLDQLGEDTKSQGLDPSESLLSWLQFSRSVMNIPAGETVDLPVLVQVNLRAKPGLYHATLHLSDGPNRVEAEASENSTASLIMTIRVLDDANERLQLGQFTTDKSLFMGDKATFGFRLDNTGNRGLTPTGKIHIFDRRGEEIDVVDINNARDRIEPDTKQQLASVWSSGVHFGKYKAMLDVSYGKTGTIQDTVFFWVLPWKKLLSFFLTLGIICTVLALLFHSYSTSGGQKLALVRTRMSSLPRNAVKKEDREDEISALARFKNALKVARSRYEVPEARTPKYVDQIKEEPAPPPQRTRYSVSSASSTAPLQLQPRNKKVAVDPAHILHLKK